MALSEMRQHYDKPGLHKTDLDPDPFTQFQHWFDQAKGAGILEPNAMSLATVTADHRPAVRIVLLKEVDAGEFVFYTSYHSDKARELADQPTASLLFFWDKLARMVRIDGTVRRNSREEAEAYFHSRPRESQLGAWASVQSQPIADRGVLEKRYADAEARYAGGEVALPGFWGGYRVRPEAIEFWQGQPSRLHDRFRYYRDAAGGWTIQRISP